MRKFKPLLGTWHSIVMRLVHTKEVPVPPFPVQLPTNVCPWEAADEDPTLLAPYCPPGRVWWSA